MSALLLSLAQLGLAGLAVTAAFLTGAVWQAQRANAYKRRVLQLVDEQHRLRRLTAARPAVAPDPDLELEAARRRSALRRSMLKLVDDQAVAP